MERTPRTFEQFQLALLTQIKKFFSTYFQIKSVFQKTSTKSCLSWLFFIHTVTDKKLILSDWLGFCRIQCIGISSRKWAWRERMQLALFELYLLLFAVSWFLSEEMIVVTFEVFSQMIKNIYLRVKNSLPTRASHTRSKSWLCQMDVSDNCQ